MWRGRRRKCVCVCVCVNDVYEGGGLVRILEGEVNFVGEVYVYFLMILLFRLVFDWYNEWNGMNGYGMGMEWMDNEWEWMLLEEMVFIDVGWYFVFIM